MAEKDEIVPQIQTQHNQVPIHWEKLNVTNDAQSQIVYRFQQFDDHNPGATLEQVLTVLRLELSIWSLSRVELFINYNIFKYVKLFLDNKQIASPAYYQGTNLLLTRIIAAIWLQE